MNRKDRYFGMSPRIARWKLDTPFENWLGYKADKSEFWKKLYVIYYKIFDRKYYKGGLPFIKEEIELKDSGDFLYDQYRRRMSDCHDSYDASLFRIQGDFGKLIDDLIQKCYYENNPYDE